MVKAGMHLGREERNGTENETFIYTEKIIFILLI
jgi:hypothetical protein